MFKLFSRARGVSDLEKTLQKNIYFSNLNARELKFLLPFMHKRTFKKGEVIFFRNELSTGVYIIQKGEIQYFIKVDQCEQEEVLRTLKPYDTVGENGFLEAKKRHLTAIATQDSTILHFIATGHLRRFAEDNPDFKNHVLEQLAQTYETYHNNILDFYIQNNSFFQLKYLYTSLS